MHRFHLYLFDSSRHCSSCFSCFYIHSSSYISLSDHPRLVAVLLDSTKISPYPLYYFLAYTDIFTKITPRPARTLILYCFLPIHHIPTRITNSTVPYILHISQNQFNDVTLPSQRASQTPQRPPSRAMWHTLPHWPRPYACGPPHPTWSHPPRRLSSCVAKIILMRT